MLERPSLYDVAALRVTATVEAVLVRCAGEGFTHGVIVVAALRRVVALVRQTRHNTSNTILLLGRVVMACCRLEAENVFFF